MVDNSNQTYNAVLQQAIQSNPQLSKNQLERLFLDQLNWSKTDFLIRAQHYMPQQQFNSFCSGVKRLTLGEPVQYIIGKEWFYGRPFSVNSSVLIPRPETELLVEMVIQSCANRQKVSVLDVGSGSGAIGITIKKECANACVSLVDISCDALAVSRENARQHGVDISFIESDVLDNVRGMYDIIVSNPPYIAYDEIDVMDGSVLAFEPHIALFADNNGLAIYEKLAKQARKHLSDEGMLFLEIGHRQGEAVSQLFQQYFPEKIVQVHKDYAQLDRIISVK